MLLAVLPALHWVLRRGLPAHCKLRPKRQEWQLVPTRAAQPPRGHQGASAHSSMASPPACLLACLCYCLSDRSGTCDRLHWSQPVGVAHAGTVRSVRSAPAVPQHRVRRGVAASPAVPEGLASSMHISACKLDERCPPCRPGGALGASYQTGPQVGGLRRHSLPPSPRPECWCRHPVMGEPDKVGHPGLEVPKAIARLPGSPFAITSVVDTST